VSSMPHDARIRVRARITPIAVDSERRASRLTPRSTIRHRAGRRVRGGTMRSTRLRPPRPSGCNPRSVTPGSIRIAPIAGAAAAIAPEPTDSTRPIRIVDACSRVTVSGTDTRRCRSRSPARPAATPMHEPDQSGDRGRGRPCTT
jgi:hypothetical protein